MNRRAFTLVELVVVVLLIGILAAVAAPRILQTSSLAAENGTRRSLYVLRQAIDAFKADNGAWPGEAGSGDFRNDIEPYLTAGRIPACLVGPAAGDNRVRVKDEGVPLSGAADPNRAWKYDNQTGEIIINSNAISSDGVTPYESL